MGLISRGDQSPSDLPVSLSVHCREHDALLFVLYQDHKLRMWSYKVSVSLLFLIDDQLLLVLQMLIIHVTVHSKYQLLAACPLAFAGSGITVSGVGLVVIHLVQM